MKIDCVYVCCNRKDRYLANICIASIRYWNESIAIKLIKDEGFGKFDTTALERSMQVETVRTDITELGYFAKLLPYMQNSKERALILDADTVWLGDLEKYLSNYDEDIIADDYQPVIMHGKEQDWYFKEPSFTHFFPGYKDPGFRFNVGQLLVNCKAFTSADFSPYVNWRQRPSSKYPAAFFHEQGIFNFIVSEKMASLAITCRLLRFHFWGWDKAVENYPLINIIHKQDTPMLIHWYGHKNGLISSLPGKKLLQFYEAFYYSRQSGTSIAWVRFNRTMCHLDAYIYTLMKRLFYFFTKSK